MMRRDAIELLVEREVVEMRPEIRSELLAEWWPLDESDSAYSELPKALQVAMKDGAELVDVQDSCYDPILYVALRRRYVGVVNEYLESRLAELGRSDVVTGAVECLVKCPCCEYRTLEARGGYDVCCVCFWEDDGTVDMDVFSSPNRMTLRDARRNFVQLGAVSEAARRHVLPDGRKRYVRENRESAV